MLNQCLAFRKKPLEERKKFILRNGICFKCCGPKRHRAANCRVNVQCDICREASHPSALHVDANPNIGEHLAGKTMKSACTQICSRPSGTSRSCAKIIPVYLKEIPDKSRIVYALVDDQSSHSLATTPFFDFFHLEVWNTNMYFLLVQEDSLLREGRVTVMSLSHWIPHASWIYLASSSATTYQRTEMRFHFPPSHVSILIFKRLLNSYLP